MTQSILQSAMSLGIAGLLFVMWWQERQERMSATDASGKGATLAQCMAETNRQLVEVIAGNTQALAALREELRSHREAIGQWLERVSRQLEDIEDNQ